MWSRAELKGRAKEAFKRNYWTCVIVALLLTILTGTAAGSATGSGNVQEEITGNISSGASTGAVVDEMEIARVILTSVVLGVAGVTAVVILLLEIFLFAPFEVGGCRFFVENIYGRPRMGEILCAFRGGAYGKIVLTLFLRNLFISLWTLLFIIPGIIKSYEYRMIPYLLAENPQMSRQEAFQESKEMMRGQKWNAFVLDLSFIGWMLLAGITCGLAGIFYVTPYIHATNAELYTALSVRGNSYDYNSYNY